MFNNIVLDVFTGLVLIYLLYSLFITIISEMVFTWMALRSRVLRVAIEKMLNDGLQPEKKANRNFLQRMWGIVQCYFLKEFDGFKYTLAGKFYANPAIKYLSDKGGEDTTVFSQTKPSYISAEMFADALIRLLKDKGVGATDFEKINFCLQFNTHQIEPESLKNLRNHAGNAAGDMTVLKDRFKAWYNETMDRATGWYKRKLQFMLFWLGLIVALIFNVDTIQIAKILSKDKDARNELVSMAIQVSKDTSRYAEFTTGKNDSVHARAILDTGYAHVTKDMHEANMVLGLGWPFEGMMHTDKSCFDKKNDAAVFKMLKDYQPVFKDFTDGYAALVKKLGLGKVKHDSLAEKLAGYKSDTVILNLELPFDTGDLKNKHTEALAKTSKFIDTTANMLKITEAKTMSDSITLHMLIQKKKNVTNYINTQAAVNFFSIDSVILQTASNNEQLIVYSSKPYTSWQKAVYIVSRFNPFSFHFWSFIFSLHFLGLLITALMLSLGAPFWFDLIKKLVALRGAGIKPEEKKTEDTKTNELPVAEVNNGVQSKPAPVAADEVTGDACDEVLKKYGPDIKKIPGVKSVFSVTKDKIKQIQVNVDSEVTKAAVLNQFPSLMAGTVNVPQNIVVSGVPLSHVGDKGIISNKSGKNGFGSLGCVLKRKETGSKHLLSCWHVLKGDIDYSDSDNQPVIIDKESGAELAYRWAGGILDKFDYGLAICKAGIVYSDNSFLKAKLAIPDAVKIEHRLVSLQDIDNQIPVKYYDSLTDTVVKGLIYTNTPAVDINYIDKTRTLQDILILTNENEQAISHEGNSGSIVFDDNNNAIAMIIAGDLNYTYAILLSNIFGVHNEMEIA